MVYGNNNNKRNLVSSSRFSDSSCRIATNSRTVEEAFQWDGPPDATVTIGGKDYLYFAGDGYLAFQVNPELTSSACQAVLQYGISTATSRTRYTPSPILAVEENAAELYKAENAVYCSSEEKAFEILFESISCLNDRFFIDENCRESLLKSIKKTTNASKKFVLFKHNDVDCLRDVIKRNLLPGERPVLVTEGVFPVLGTIAPLDDYFDILKNYENSSLIIDDSHSLGVLGENGRGVLEYFQYDVRGINQTNEDLDQNNIFDTDFYLLNEINDETTDSFLKGNRTSRNSFQPNRIVSNVEDAKSSTLKSLPVRTYLFASLSKAIGGFGGVIPGSELFVERLREILQRHSDSVPPTSIAAATAKGLELSLRRSEIRQKLWDNTRYLKRAIKEIGLPVENNAVPILALNLGSSQNMRRIHQYLFDRQIIVSFVPRQNYLGAKGVLRTALFATHEKNMLDAFVDVLLEAIR